MHHHINHCWCSNAEHNNESYDAPNMVDIDRLEHDDEDWIKMIDIKQVVSQEKRNTFEGMKEQFPDMDIERMAITDCPVLKNEVVDWLNENIKPQKDGEPGWAIGNDEYRLIQNYRLTLWFQRRNDAKKFIRTWSKYKKSTSYFNYFDDPITNLVLNLETGKHEDRHN